MIYSDNQDIISFYSLQSQYKTTSMFICPRYLLSGDLMYPTSMKTIQTADVKHNLNGNL